MNWRESPGLAPGCWLQFDSVPIPAENSDNRTGNARSAIDPENSGAFRYSGEDKKSIPLISPYSMISFRSANRVK